MMQKFDVFPWVSSRRVLFSLITCAFLVAASSCSGCRNKNNDDAECSGDDGCDAGFYCSSGGSCTQDCDPTSTTKTCETGESCTPNGKCVDSTVSCSINSDCDLPPDARVYCDGQTSVREAVIGRCISLSEEEGKMCRYDDDRTPCLEGCNEETGECVPRTPDPCDDVVCDQSPQNTCKDGQTLTRYPNMGTCNEGMCVYQPGDVDCPTGCENGACNPGICEDDTCNMATPPEATCSQADPRVAIAASGDPTCVEEEGSPVCEFTITQTNCAYIGGTCNAGACDGAVTQSGEVVITEYMVDPAGMGTPSNSAQWIEVTNASGGALDLSGWVLRIEDTNGNSSDHTIGAVMLPQDGRILLANGSDPLFDGATTPDVQYMDIVMRSAGSISLRKPGGEVSDYLFWESGAHARGYARQLDASAEVTAIANDNPGSWCPNISDSFGGGNNGTPKGANTACPADPCMGVSCNSAPAPSCNGQGNAVAPANPNPTCMANAFGNPSCDYQVMETTCDPNTTRCMNGACEMLPSNLPGAGDVIFTEFLGNPIGDDNTYEWIELHNTTASEISLFSMLIEDNEAGGAFTSWSIMDQNAVIPANGYVILAPNTDSATNGGLTGAYQLVTGLLKNAPDLDVNGQSAMRISLKLADGTVIDEAYYGTPVEGVSQQLSSSAYVGMGAAAATSNDGAANFCDATMSYDVGIGTGSPGAANEACP